jgi:hypothetical protein
MLDVSCGYHRLAPFELGLEEGSDRGWRGWASFG